MPNESKNTPDPQRTRECVLRIAEACKKRDKQALCQACVMFGMFINSKIQAQPDPPEKKRGALEKAQDVFANLEFVEGLHLPETLRESLPVETLGLLSEARILLSQQLADQLESDPNAIDMIKSCQELGMGLDIFKTILTKQLSKEEATRYFTAGQQGYLDRHGGEKLSVREQDELWHSRSQRLLDRTVWPFIVKMHKQTSEQFSPNQMQHSTQRLLKSVSTVTHAIHGTLFRRNATHKDRADSGKETLLQENEKNAHRHR